MQVEMLVHAEESKNTRWGTPEGCGAPGSRADPPRPQQAIHLARDRPSRTIRLPPDARGRATAADPPAAAPNAGYG